MKALILGNADKDEITKKVDEFVPILCRECEVLAVDLHQKEDLSKYPNADVAFVFGGDGAILRAVRQMGYSQVPVLGINVGRLGFLADLDKEDLTDLLPHILSGGFQTSNHLMYECIVKSNSSALDEQSDRTKVMLGLNEAVFHTLPPYHILDLDLRIDEIVVARFRGDGLIISTPVGSTGHSLSAGGPILGNELSAFVITPICPHTLTNRPVVESANKTYTIRICGRSKEAALIIDGQECLTVTAGEEIVIKKAPVSFRRIRIPDRQFYRTLREKLNWSSLPNYRAEQ